MRNSDPPPPLSLDFESISSPEEPSPTLENLSIDLSPIISFYDKEPWFLTIDEAETMWASYSTSYLQKHGTENISRFLNCHKRNWREVWNTIHRSSDSLIVEEDR